MTRPSKPLVVRGPRGRIDSIWSWYSCAPPKDPPKQWKERCSAMEVARAWCVGGRPKIPHVVTSTLDQNPATAGFVGWDVDVEHVTTFDGFPGEGRNHDLVIVGECGARPTLVAIEAKALEPFGESVQVTVTRALKRSTKSRVPQRVDLLSDAVRGKPAMADGQPIVDVEIAEIGYQLFTAAVGAVVEADRRHCPQAVVLIHRFVEPAPTARQAEAYAKALGDLAAFTKLLAGDQRQPLGAGRCVGPFRLHPTAAVSGDVDLYVAHCETVLAA